MAVSKNEISFDETFGFSVKDLGECSPGKNSLCFLVSVYKSPLQIPHSSFQVQENATNERSVFGERTNNYVVFVSKNYDVDYYSWEIIRDEIFINKKQTKFGLLKWKPDGPGDFKIKVKLHKNNNIIDEAELDQAAEYILAPLHFTIPIKKDLKRSVPQGNDEIISSIFYDLRVYVNDFLKIMPLGKITERAFCSIIYTTMLGSRKTYDSFWMERKKRLKPGEMIEIPLPKYTFPRIGLSQMKPEIVALYLDEEFNESNKTLSPNNLKKKYLKYDEEKSRVLKNLLRFPKSNISITLQILNKIAADSNIFETSDNIINSVKTIASIFKYGGISFAIKGKKTNKYFINKFGGNVGINYDIPSFQKCLNPHEEEPYKEIDSQWINPNGNKDKVKMAKMHFHNQPESYRYLYRYYKEENISNPMQWVIDNIVPVHLNMVKAKKIGNRIVYVHRDIEKFLKKVDEELNPSDYMLVNDDPRYCFNMGGFSPRLIAGDEYYLSDHAKGKAIDFDSQTNPHLFSDRIDKIIDFFRKIDSDPDFQSEVLEDSDDLYSAHPVEKIDEKQHYIEEMRRLNDDFMIKFKKYLDDLTAENDGGLVIQSMDSKYFALFLIFLKGGFFTLPDVLVMSMIDNGFRWGGFYKNSRDFMHFEYK